MRNKILFALLICFGSFTSWAQTIPNYSFESWALDTNYLDLTLANPALLDTSVSYNPVGWTTSNEVTHGKVFHSKSLVSQSSNFYIGSSAIQLTNDTLTALINNLPLVGSLSLNFVCPGFAVCGVFPINLSSFVTLGSQFNPALLPGAGIPVTTRYSKIGGYMRYTPVGGDSAYVVAILRQGTTVVATATYTRNTTDNAYSYFEAPFVYQNCLLPDTLVYTISSGNPYSISGVAFGNASGLHVGSSVLVDSIFIGDSIIGLNISEPLNDSAHTLINTAVSIPVTANDATCGNGSFVLTQSAAPNHGSITISGTNIVYTPSNNFLGIDTFVYSESVNGGPTATAVVTVRVSCGTATPVNDSAHTNIQTPVSINVTANDPDCGGSAFTVVSSIAPKHGTITISGDTIKYTPDSGYVGLDTFTYSESVGGGGSGTAEVIVSISYPLGISTIAEGKTSVYPNPASNKLYISTSNPSISELHIYDMLGKVMKSDNFSSSAAIDLSGFSNGLYIIQFSGADGKTISSSRFTVIK